jgi:hypothetical protein
MTDEELIQTYTKSYDAEYDEQFKLSHTFYEKARDKAYALQLGMFAVSISYAFRHSTELHKTINDVYDHSYKLGYSTPDMIKSIPGLTQEYLVKKEEKEKNRKNEIKIEWEKFASFIPYKIKRIHVKGAFSSSSPFERITDIEDIAIEFGRHRAIIDLFTELKLKLSDLGVVIDEKQNTLEITEKPILIKLKRALADNDLDTFFQILQSLLATISYNEKITEAYFHCLIHMILKLSDVVIQSEVESNEGRIDSVTETDRYIHVFEFKLDNCKIALNQIKEKNYYQTYLNSQKEIILVGVSFDKNKKNITDWASEKFNRNALNK